MYLTAHTHHKHTAANLFVHVDKFENDMSFVSHSSIKDNFLVSKELSIAFQPWFDDLRKMGGSCAQVSADTQNTEFGVGRYEAYYTYLSRQTSLAN